MPHKFRELMIWQRAMDLVTHVYLLSRQFPQDELFGLTSQLRRAATSIALNIAEGAGGSSANDFKRFLDIALKSTYETIRRSKSECDSATTTIKMCSRYSMRPIK